MPIHSYTSRRELEQHSFHPAVTLLVPVADIVLQALLPRSFPRLMILDLPLIVAIFFTVPRRSPIAVTLTRPAIGLLPDAITARPPGVNRHAQPATRYARPTTALHTRL